MKKGDKVLYIYNVPWEGRGNLKGSIGTIYGIEDDGICDDDGNFICPEYCGCHWVNKNCENFDWWVPETHIRLLKSGEM